MESSSKRIQVLPARERIDILWTHSDIQGMFSGPVVTYTSMSIMHVVCLYISHLVQQTNGSVPSVMPRVFLAITLTGMGNYNTQESSDLECQGSNQGAGFIDLSRYIRVASFSLLVLLSSCLLGSRFYSAFQGWVVPVCHHPTCNAALALSRVWSFMTLYLDMAE